MMGVQWTQFWTKAFESFRSKPAAARHRDSLPCRYVTAFLILTSIPHGLGYTRFLRMIEIALLLAA